MGTPNAPAPAGPLASPAKAERAAAGAACSRGGSFSSTPMARASDCGECRGWLRYDLPCPSGRTEVTLGQSGQRIAVDDRMRAGCLVDRSGQRQHHAHCRTPARFGRRVVFRIAGGQRGGWFIAVRRSEYRDRPWIGRRRCGIRLRVGGLLPREELGLPGVAGRAVAEQRARLGPRGSPAGDHGGTASPRRVRPKERKRPRQSSEPDPSSSLESPSTLHPLVVLPRRLPQPPYPVSGP